MAARHRFREGARRRQGKTGAGSGTRRARQRRGRARSLPDRSTARPKPRRARPRRGGSSRGKLFIDAAALLPTRHFRLGHGGRRSRGTCTMFSRTRARKYRGSVYLSYFAACFSCYFLVFLLRCYCTAFRRGYFSLLSISLWSSYHFNNSFSPKL